jgi:anti-sigma regulatory factor (Ser/Thr protein kinase)
VVAGRDQVIDIEIGILRSDVRLELPACEASLPVVRQALRSIGETVEADEEALEDAELAVTEALANAVEHAYADGAGGAVHVTFLPREEEMLVCVRDFGCGMGASGHPSKEGPGYGLSMIEAIARRVAIRAEDGTEVEMAFGLGVADAATVDGGAPGIVPAERILRRVIAVVAAQVDMSVERVMEALLVVELVARHSLRYLVGDHVMIRVTRGEAAFDLRVGPLEQGAARNVVQDTEIPVVGSVVERLADDVRAEKARAEDIDCEYLLLRLAT